MKTIIALALIIFANSATANGFSPWNDVEKATNTEVSATTAVSNAGFAPWRQRSIANEVSLNPQQGEIFVKHAESVFSPWS